MAEPKLYPCEKCQYRRVMAKAFDVHIWGEECPVANDPGVCRYEERGEDYDGV